MDSSLSSLLPSSSSLSSPLLSVEPEINAVNDQINAVNDQINAVNKQINAVNEQINAANEQINAANKQIDEANKQLMKIPIIDEDKQHWRKEVDYLRQEKEKLNQVIEKLNQVIEKLNQEKVELRTRAVTAASDLSRKRSQKRKSLPAPCSGSSWTVQTLKDFSITIENASLDELFNVFDHWRPPQPVPFQPTSYATDAIEACEFISNVLLHIDKSPLAFESKLDELSVPSSGVGRTLIKYIRLMFPRSPYSMLLESIVDDFVIHLLCALGFNAGPLLILSKNQLKFSMNGKEISNMEATADVTVYHTSNGLRVGVFEDKRCESRIPGQTLNSEAQLVAEAVAAVQSNLALNDKKRSKSVGDVAGSIPSASIDSSGAIFLIRVIGYCFSFYSCNFDRQVINIIKDYNEAGDEVKPTLVYKLTTSPENGGTVSASSSSNGEVSEFSFIDADQRKCIINFLDRMRQTILQTQI